MASASIGTLTVDLIAKMGGFDEGLNKTDRRMKKTADNIDKFTKRASKAIAGMGVAAAGVTAALIKNQADEATAYLQTARALDIKIEALSAGSYAAKQFGIDNEKYADILKDTSDKIGDFIATGGGGMADFFENIAPQVGVTAEQFKKLNGQDALQLYVSSLEAANVSQSEMTFYMEALASDASDLIPLFADNGKEMARFTDRAKELGVVLDQDTAEGAEAFNRTMGDLKAAVGGAGNEVLQSLLPQMRDFTDLMNDPATIDGLKGIVGGVADLSKWMVQLLVDTKNVTQFIAEEVAATLNGAAAGDIARLEEQAQKVRDLLSDDSLFGLTNRLRFFGKDGVVEYYNEEELKAELAKLESQIADFYKAPSAPSPLAGLTEDALDFSYVLNGVRESVGSVNAPFSKLLANLEQERILLEQGERAAYKYSLRLEKFNDEQIEAALAIYDYNQSLRDQKDVLDQLMSGSVDTSYVLDIGEDYNALGDISNGVMSGLVTDADGAFDNIGQNFTRLLGNMADEALRNQIELQFSTAQSGGTGADDANQAGGAIAAGGIYAAIAVAVIAGVNEWNSQQDDKFANLTAEVRQGNQSTGTLLGALDDKSFSLNNVIADLEQTAGDALNVNNAQLQTLLDIRTGITGVAQGFARTGFGSATADVYSGYQFGTTLPGEIGSEHGSLGIGHRILRGADNLDLLVNPIDEFVLDFLDGIAGEITGQLFRSKTKLTDSGIQVFGGTLQDIIDGGLLDAQAYADITKEKKIFGISTGKDFETLTEDLDQQVLQQLTGVFRSAGVALESASEQYGIDFGARAGELIIDAGRLSLKDLKGDELTEEIESFFSSTLDQWATTLLSHTEVLKEFQQVGEGAFETMLRLSSQTAEFADAAKRLSLNFEATGTDAVFQSQGVISAAGGQDVLSQYLATYSNAFLSDADRFNNLEGQITDVFTSLGQAVPQTAQAYRDMVQAQEVVTEAGQEQLATLLSLAGATDEYLQALKDQADTEQQWREQEIRDREAGQKAWADYLAEQAGILDDFKNRTSGALSDLRGVIDSEIGQLSTAHQSTVDAINADFDTKANNINSWLDAQLSRFERRSTALSGSINDLTSLASALESAVGSLQVQSFSLDQNRFNAARGDISSLLATANNGGGLPSADIINALAGDLSNGEQFFTTAEAFGLAMGHAVNDLAQLQKATGVELTDQQKLLAQLQQDEKNAQSRNAALLASNDRNRDKALADAQEKFDEEKQLLEDQYKLFEDQVNALHGIDDKALNLEAAINNMRTQLSAEQAERARQDNSELKAMRNHLADIANNTGVQAAKIRQDYYDQYADNGSAA
ncbi:hypothetical protein [Gilvimarinus agarilyticus]|uniref:hypothetical protein n=1 Tax=Gilvimarinus agarilyticus TaxID=679259 RepID=UPI0006991AB5|nr:hypothetical protein [Gilvimarinus agarilyticus]